MNEVRLADFGCYSATIGVLFDDITGKVLEPIRHKKATKAGNSGFFQLRRIGLWRRREIVVACYLDGESNVVVWVDQMKYVLTTQNLSQWTIDVKGRYFCIRHCAVGFAASFKTFYYYCGSSDDWPGDSDLLRWISREVRTADQIREFITFWKANRCSALNG